jgi:lipoate synthase
MGFSWIKAGPLVRSSYHAEETQAGRTAATNNSNEGA